MAVANSTTSLKCEVCTATLTLSNKFCATCGAELDEEMLALFCVALAHSAAQNKRRNTTDRNTTQLNSPQHNETGNQNHVHVLNKPVKVVLSSTKNSTKTGVETMQVYGFWEP